MKKVLLATILMVGVLAACKFPLSDKVNHRKVTFETQYGLTLAADLYEPKDAQGKLAAIAVSGPFGAVKEQSSGLYAMKMAERGFVALAFDPSYTGESSGEPRRTASPDINTEDFMAAVDFISKQENVDAEKIGIIASVATATSTAKTRRSRAMQPVRLWPSSASPTRWLWLGVW